MMKKYIVAKDKIHLEKLISEEIKLNGYQCDLNHIHVSNIVDMSSLFKDSHFNGNISEWDVSNITIMNSMFENSKFNGDISKWNVSNIKNMSYMFCNSIFNNDISQWDVSNVQNMAYMFYKSQFNHNLSNWTPYFLNNKNNMFLETQAVIPYWVEYDNLEFDARTKAIKIYQEKKKLMNDLNNKLGVNDINTLMKRIKI